MTFAKHLFRGVALSALAVGLTGTATAQDGKNWHILGNFGEVLYLGSGAGGTSVPGVDMQGYWMAGQDMQGATYSGLELGGVPQFGYQQTGMRLLVCVANNPVRLDLPAIMMAEYDTDAVGAEAFSFHNPFAFVRPGCDDGALPPGTLHTAFDPLRDVASVGPFGMTLGSPPGASFNVLVQGGPSFLPAGVVYAGPNEGLLPSASGGTQAFIVLVSVSVPISSTGCFAFDLDWTVAPGSSVPALDDISGWWTNLTASRDNNQYWSNSKDHLNVVQPISIFSDVGGTAFFTSLATLDIEVHSFSADPVTNIALGPMAYTTTSVYQAQPEGQILLMGTPLNPGFDLGIAPAYSLGAATYGAVQIFSGTDEGVTVAFPTGVANAQDPANAGLTINPTTGTGAPVFSTIGFVTWNNNPYVASTAADRLTWVQLDWDITANRSVAGVFAADGPMDPSAQTAATFGAFPGVRVPLRTPVANVGSWPQSFTAKLFDDFIHTPIDRVGDTTWPDPTGFAAGTLGIPAVVASSTHLPTFTASGACQLGGLPIGISYCTTGINAAGTGLTFNPADNRVSVGRSVLLYD